MKLIKRTDYDERLDSLRGTPDIKILSGMRRVGKSKLLAEAAKRIRKSGRRVNVIFADLTLLKNEGIREYHALYDWVKSQTKEKAVNCVMLDEVQMCPNFELAINSLHAESDGRYDIYLTGSNAFLLSSDLTTLFTGRHFDLKTYPFSFREFRAYFAAEKDVDRAFDRYVVEGGLAGSYLHREDSARVEYLREVYQTIIRRDIARWLSR